MASAEQLKALLKAHIDGDDSHFLAVAMQVAAHEAKLGHGKLAEELKDLIDAAKARRLTSATSRPTPISQPRGELASLLAASYPKLTLRDMILGPSVHERLSRIIKEHRQSAKIRSHGLAPKRKLLLVGPPGTGKTMTASVLAGELGMPLFQVRLDGLISKFMGETAAKLRLIFHAVAEQRGIYFFDEFDAIASQRGMTNDVGEIRRVLNSFLQLIEQDESNSLIIAATNHPEILDYAVFRRFDDVIEYGLPTEKQIIATLKARLSVLEVTSLDWVKLADEAAGLSFADLSRAADDATKDAIIHDRRQLTEADVLAPLAERKAMRSR
jgi:SpoVK/Ycf46/Vps4 family AAA+-type ATPase